MFIKLLKKNCFNLEYVGFFCFALLIIASFLERMATIAYLSSFSLIIICAHFIIKKDYDFKAILKNLILERKVFILMNLWCLICICLFTYGDFSLKALNIFYRNWRFALVILLFCITFQSKNYEIKKTINCSMIICSCFILYIYPFLSRLEGYSEPFYLILRGHSGKYIPIFFPFILSTFFYCKSVFVKICMLIFIISSFIILFYSGFRGAILAIIIESAIIIFYFSKNIKTFLMHSLGFGIILIIFSLISYNTIPQFKQKINQTLNNHNISSSRDLIIKSRLSLIMNSPQNIISGIGYNSVSYNQYLSEHNALKADGIGRYDKNVYKYNNDEPFFFTIFYNIGIVGLLLFVCSYFINLRDIHNRLKVEKDIFNISFMSFGIGYFLVFCSFELISMKIFILFNILSTLSIQKKLDNH